MSKCLYMICPTDFMESAIDRSFDGQKYFYSSLGMSLAMDNDMLSDIVEVIQKYDIKEITFVLSEDNSIILDALNNQEFSTIRGLKESYDQIHEYNYIALHNWRSYNPHFIFLSYYLNRKIEELHDALRDLLTGPLVINGKLYSLAYDSFRTICPPLACINSASLN